jgi:Ca2+-binding EF-hand superfamily protein
LNIYEQIKKIAGGSVSREKAKELVNKFWDEIEIDKNNQLDRNECRLLIDKVVFKLLKRGTYSTSKINRLFDEIDTDGSGMLSKNELVEFLMKLSNNAPKPRSETKSQGSKVDL